MENEFKKNLQAQAETEEAIKALDKVYYMQGRKFEDEDKEKLRRYMNMLDKGDR